MISNKYEAMASPVEFPALMVHRETGMVILASHHDASLTLKGSATGWYRGTVVCVGTSDVTLGEYAKDLLAVLFEPYSGTIELIA